MGFGFLLGFPTRTLASGFADFHETGWKSPGPITRLDRFAAKQHLLAPNGDRARDRSRLDVVDRAAASQHARSRESPGGTRRVMPWPVHTGDASPSLFGEHGPAVRVDPGQHDSRQVGSIEMRRCKGGARVRLASSNESLIQPDRT